MSPRLILLSLLLAGCSRPAPHEATPMTANGIEKQLTNAPYTHILTNVGVWSHDGRWIVYDVRSNPDGSIFDGDRIERVNVETGEVQVLYRAKEGAKVGVVTCSPVDDRVVFIHGPANPTPGWSYNAYHRRGVIVHAQKPGLTVNLDARDIVAPFTPGALRGGTHVHTFDNKGEWVAFTYEDHVLANAPPGGELNQRNVGVSVPLRAVKVPKTHPRNHDGSHFTVLVTRTHNQPRPASDEISKAFEESWVPGRRSLAFQGNVMTAKEETISEVFIVDLPGDVTVPGDGPLEGTATTRPAPPKGTVQRRLTFTADRKYPGIQGPRQWLRASPDGQRIAFLMKDDEGVVQIWTVSPDGGPPMQLSRHPWDIASAFTWSPDGNWIAHVMDGSVFVTDTATGEGRRLTASSDPGPRPEACVFSPEGARIAYTKLVADGEAAFAQIFAVDYGK